MHLLTKADVITRHRGQYRDEADDYKSWWRLARRSHVPTIDVRWSGRNGVGGNSSMISRARARAQRARSAADPGGTIAKLPEPLQRPQYCLSVAQFVGRRKRPTRVDGGGASTAAKDGTNSGPGARSGRSARSRKRSARSVARKVRAGGLVAESRNHWHGGRRPTSPKPRELKAARLNDGDI
jgi:hypothetical protein